MQKNSSILFRLDDEKKIEFKVALLKQRVSMQDILESFIDQFVSFDKGEKNPLIEKIVKKAKS